MKTIYPLKGEYAPTFKNIIHVDGKIAANKIQQEADQRYSTFLPRHNNLRGVAMMHWKQCCERAALYLSIKDAYPSQALEWIALSTKAQGEKVGASINKTLMIPAMKKLFIPMMKKVANLMFGTKAGFRNQLVSYDKNSIRFDILKCPYCEYLSELGCPELTVVFCESDEYAYGCLEVMEFRRTQTLGTGGDKCDFYMAVKKEER